MEAKRERKIEEMEAKKERKRKREEDKIKRERKKRKTIWSWNLRLWFYQQKKNILFYLFIFSAQNGSEKMA